MNFDWLKDDTNFVRSNNGTICKFVTKNKSTLYSLGHIKALVDWCMDSTSYSVPISNMFTMRNKYNVISQVGTFGVIVVALLQGNIFQDYPLYL